MKRGSRSALDWNKEIGETSGANKTNMKKGGKLNVAKQSSLFPDDHSISDKEDNIHVKCTKRNTTIQYNTIQYNIIDFLLEMNLLH